VHFHVCVVNGVFEAVAGPIAQSVDAAAQANPEPGLEPTPQSVIFHAATGLDEAAISQVQANVRKRILRAFVARGHIEACDAKDMAAYAHGGGFSVDGNSFRGLIEAPIRARKGDVSWKDVAIFHYQPRGDDHGPAYSAGARISSTQASRDKHRAFAQHDLSVHQGTRSVLLACASLRSQAWKSRTQFGPYW